MCGSQASTAALDKLKLPRRRRTYKHSILPLIGTQLHSYGTAGHSHRGKRRLSCNRSNSIQQQMRKEEATSPADENAVCLVAIVMPLGTEKPKAWSLRNSLHHPARSCCCCEGAGTSSSAAWLFNMLMGSSHSWHTGCTDQLSTPCMTWGLLHCR